MGVIRQHLKVVESLRILVMRARSNVRCAVVKRGGTIGGWPWLCRPRHRFGRFLVLLWFYRS